MPGILKKRQTIHRQLEQSQIRLQDLSQQLQSTQKLATLGTMACLAAHEFNNLLTPMISYAELALQHPEDSALTRKALEKVIQHGKRAAQMIESMLGQTHKQSQELQILPLLPLVEDCFQTLVRDFKKDKIEVKLNIPPNLQVKVFPGPFQQVMLNLIINARQAMLERGGRLTIMAITLADHRRQIQVADTGCGIAPDHLSHIFEPFFTTKTDPTRPHERGTGLGLAVCKTIMEDHDGSISVESVPGQGSTFTLILPAIQD